MNFILYRFSVQDLWIGEGPIVEKEIGSSDSGFAGSFSDNLHKIAVDVGTALHDTFSYPGMKA